MVERYREMIGALQHDLQALSRHPPPLVPPLLRGSARRVTFVTQASNLLRFKVKSRGNQVATLFLASLLCLPGGAEGKFVPSSDLIVNTPRPEPA